MVIIMIMHNYCALLALMLAVGRLLVVHGCVEIC